MTKLCLRCDWTGETKERTCPSCGAPLFRPPGAAEPRRRTRWRRRGDTATLASPPTPAAESFDPSAPPHSEDDATVEASHRVAWVALSLAVLAAAVVAVAIVQSSAPAGPVEGVEGDLVLLSSEPDAQARLWIWDLASGAVDEGPIVGAPLQLVETYLADPEGGWVGIVSEDGDEQVASLLRNFDPVDVPEPLLRGDLVSWSSGGDRVAVASGSAGGCSLRWQILHVASSRVTPPTRDSACDPLAALALNGQSLHVGMGGESPWVGQLRDGELTPWLDGASLFAATSTGGALVVTGCGPDARPRRCGALAYADPSSSGRPVSFGERGQGVLKPERFLGWSRDDRTGYVVGTYGEAEVRGIYAITPSRETPQPPRLVLASLATDLSVTETTGANGRELVVSRDGALVFLRADGEQVPLDVPDVVPSPPVGPILWLPSVGGG